MAAKYWYTVYGEHKKFGSEELYIGDVIGKNQVAAKLTAERRFGERWKVTKVKREKAASTSDVLRFYSGG